jgi:competence protein ComEC
VTVLDVGQGLAAVVETHDHALVFDTGPSFRTGTDTGQLVVVPYLRHRGIRELDMLVVSHDDDDHKGGAASVLEWMPTRAVVVGPSLSPHPDPLPLERERGQDGGRCQRGTRWSWDGVEFEWLHPGPKRYERDNDSSCVLLIRAGGHALLLTGDIEAEAEADLVDAHSALDVDVVVVPHHGSRTSSTQGFVTATRPEWVIYPVGLHNRWGFPVRRVVERWERVGAGDVRTSTGGAITMVLDPRQPLRSPVQWRLEHPRPWRDP